MTLNTKVERRNCKDYVIINDVSSGSNSNPSVQYSHIAINFKYDNAAPILNEFLNREVNANWKMFKCMVDPSTDKLVESALPSILTPIFEQIAIQDLFEMK